MRRSSCFVLVTLAAVLIGDTVAAAHSFPARETPAAGQTLHAAPAAIVIRYDAPIEKLFARLQVIGPDGQSVTDAPPEVSADGYTLSVKLGALKPGVYRVQWMVTCIDTHRTEGSYRFTLAPPAS
jgi:methionine-rich copper-binding protein CopC